MVDKKTFKFRKTKVHCKGGKQGGLWLPERPTSKSVKLFKNNLTIRVSTTFDYK